MMYSQSSCFWYPFQLLCTNDRSVSRVSTYHWIQKVSYRCTLNICGCGCDSVCVCDGFVLIDIRIYDRREGYRWQSNITCNCHATASGLATRAVPTSLLRTVIKNLIFGVTNTMVRTTLVTMIWSCCWTSKRQNCCWGVR
jgi:hypothetical protein